METETKDKKEAVKVAGLVVPKWVRKGIEWKPDYVAQAFVFGAMFLCAAMGIILTCTASDSWHHARNLHPLLTSPIEGEEHRKFPQIHKRLYL